MFEAYALLQYADTLRPQDPEKQRDFQKSIVGIRQNLGIPVDANAENLKIIHENHVLGPGRQRMEAAGYRAVQSGEYQNMKFNADTREMSFEHPLKEYALVIDAKKEPPTQRITQSGLSIEQTIPEMTPQERQRDQLSETIRAEQKNTSEQQTRYTDSRRNEYQKATGDTSIYATFRYENAEQEQEYQRQEQKLLSGNASEAEQLQSIETMLQLCQDME